MIAPGAGRPIVLYVVHRLPYPPDKGDRIRAYHLLRTLAKRATVHLACLADEPPADGAISALQDLCERVAVVRIGRWARLARAAGSLARGRTATEGAFDSPTLRSTLRRWARRTHYHAALASSSSMVPYLRMPEFRDVPAVIDLVDVDSEKWFDYAGAGSSPRAWLYRAEGRRLRSMERDLTGWARAVTLISEAEAAIYRGFQPSGAVYAVTNGVDLDYFRPQATPIRQRCLFVGALDYLPNVDAVHWFCRDVWPGILRRHPHATFGLVGRRPEPSVRRLAALEGVELVGQVPDVRPYMAEAAVVVAPLRIARGVQNKVLEALAMGKAVVSSPQALAGLGAEPGIHLCVASSSPEWVESVSRILEDDELGRRLGQEGRRHVETYHRWDDCLGQLASLLGLSPGHSAPADASAPLSRGPAPRACRDDCGPIRGAGNGGP